MGLLLEWFVEDPVKRRILDWAKSLIIVFIFITVITYYLSGSTYMQGWNDCRDQIQRQLDIFPHWNDSNFSFNFSLDYQKNVKSTDLET